MAVVSIELAGCINCGWCRRVCPTETIKYFSTGHRTHVVDPDGCIDCGICAPVCPVQVIHDVAEYVVAPERLAAAKEKARAFAARERQARLERDAVVERTLARLGGGRAAHA